VRDLPPPPPSQPRDAFIDRDAFLPRQTSYAESPRRKAWIQLTCSRLIMLLTGTLD
jgi:hypothetical protein